MIFLGTRGFVLLTEFDVSKVLKPQTENTAKVIFS